MSRYTGPRVRLSRRFGVPLFGSSKYLERRSYGPGQHGPRGGRRKMTDYAMALAEKQKVRFFYGLPKGGLIPNNILKTSVLKIKGGLYL